MVGVTGFEFVLCIKISCIRSLLMFMAAILILRSYANNNQKANKGKNKGNEMQFFTCLQPL